jgi:hypothetical protein
MTRGGRTLSVALALALTVEFAMIGMAMAPSAQAQVTEGQPEAYHTYDEMKQDMQALAEEYDAAEFRGVGTSTLDQEIFVVDVAANISDRSEEELAQLPTLYVDGAHHGNEILSAEAAYYFLTRVLENATEEGASYLEDKRLVVNPIVNPDGYTRDQRENTNGVDLNRNYPFHWGLYGTSDQPFTGNYRGEEPASETETQTNMELMRDLNLYAYLTGHTGTYDLVLPWSEDQDGEIPDWPTYETWLTNIENETGLEYRDPSGAGEAHAWAYGNRSAMALLPEVDEEQSAPASTEEVEARLNEVLGVYELTWDNLHHLGGALHLEDVNGTSVTVLNDGWGPAYNLTPLPTPASNVDDGTADTGASDNGTGDNATDTTSVPVPDRQIAPGEEVTLDLPEGTEELGYERVTIDGDDPEQKIKTLSFPAPLNASTETQTDDGGFLSVPGPGLALLVAVFAALAPARTRRRP